ncbi:DUF4164 family protein [Crocosphaera chwakensis]|uniref:Uncharacterized protein n=1 Tax=Crocosphaera chwakensis CCY0110 TaxID=391612 RepID=A3IU14_9CHRO|nr:DUF4164 family protein [Crocosphaera chwakensis]EAZ89988.1 hypothetical protein CY0110_20635 [Crocosphaera chwakensis CCY0110]
MNEPVTVKYSLEDILTKIDDKLDRMEEASTQRFEKLESKLESNQRDVNQKLDTLQKDVTDLKVGQAKLEEKVEGLTKRLDYQEFINRGVIIGLIVALLGGLAKMFGFIGNP